MNSLNKYHTEKELAQALKEKTGQGSPRTLRSWRQRRIGPPWLKVGKAVMYSDDGFETWLKSQVQQPARSRRQHRKNPAAQCFRAQTGVETISLTPLL